MQATLSANRRQFLGGSAALGLVIGFQLPMGKRAAAAANGEFVPNAFLRIAPDNMRLLNDAAVYHCYKNEWQKAREFLVRAEKADPKDLYVKHNLAKADVKLGEPEAARRKWEEIIKLSPKSEEATAAREEIAKLPKKPGKK